MSKCMTPGCLRVTKKMIRGLCGPCYENARIKVVAGYTTWKNEAEYGRCRAKHGNATHDMKSSHDDTLFVVISMAGDVMGVFGSFTDAQSACAMTWMDARIDTDQWIITSRGSQVALLEMCEGPDGPFNMLKPA